MIAIPQILCEIMAEKCLTKTGTGKTKRLKNYEGVLKMRKITIEINELDEQRMIHNEETITDSDLTVTFPEEFLKQLNEHQMHIYWLVVAKLIKEINKDATTDNSTGRHSNT